LLGWRPLLVRVLGGLSAALLGVRRWSGWRWRSLVARLHHGVAWLRLCLGPAMTSRRWLVRLLLISLLLVLLVLGVGSRCRWRVRGWWL
jgi:hypothetical protein